MLTASGATVLAICTVTKGKGQRTGLTREKENNLRLLKTEHVAPSCGASEKLLAILLAALYRIPREETG